jgi:hypothetical protein
MGDDKGLSDYLSKYGTQIIIFLNPLKNSKFLSKDLSLRSNKYPIRPGMENKSLINRTQSGWFHKPTSL